MEVGRNEFVLGVGECDMHPLELGVNDRSH